MYKRNILENALIKLSNPQLKKFDLDNVNIEDLFNLALRHDVFSIVYLNVSRQEKFKKCKICSSKRRIKNIYVKGVKNDLVKSHIRVGDIITDAVSIPNLLNLKDL